jgi:hypothetical protein
VRAVARGRGEYPGEVRQCSRKRSEASVRFSRRRSKEDPFVPGVTTHKGVLDRTAALLIVRYRLVPCTRLTHYDMPRTATPSTDSTK